VRVVAELCTLENVSTPLSVPPMYPAAFELEQLEHETDFAPPDSVADSPS
jgi:hypothetical protein